MSKDPTEKLKVGYASSALETAKKRNARFPTDHHNKLQLTLFLGSLISKPW